jgi:hypothetical protein
MPEVPLCSTGIRYTIPTGDINSEVYDLRYQIFFNWTYFDWNDLEFSDEVSTKVHVWGAIVFHPY